MPVIDRQKFVKNTPRAKAEESKNTKSQSISKTVSKQPRAKFKQPTKANNREEASQTVSTSKLVLAKKTARSPTNSVLETKSYCKTRSKVHKSFSPIKKGGEKTTKNNKNQQLQQQRQKSVNKNLDPQERSIKSKKKKVKGENSVGGAAFHQQQLFGRRTVKKFVSCPISGQKVNNFVTTMKKRRSVVTEKASTMATHAFRKGEVVFVTKKSREKMLEQQPPEIDGETFCDFIDSEDMKLPPDDAENNVYMNNENGGKLLINGRPFWVYPVAPTRDDMTNVDETVEMNAESIIQVSDGRIKLKAMPTLFVSLDPSAELETLKTRDSNFFIFPIVYGNTLRSLINTTNHDEAEPKTIGEPKTRKIEILNRKKLILIIPNRTIFYSRKTRKMIRVDDELTKPALP